MGEYASGANVGDQKKLEDLIVTDKRAGIRAMTMGLNGSFLRGDGAFAAYLARPSAVCSSIPTGLIPVQGERLKCRHGFSLHRIALPPLHFEYSLLAITPKSDIESLPPQAKIGQRHVRQPIRQRGIDI